jgi:serine protease Do
MKTIRQALATLVATMCYLTCCLSAAPAKAQSMRQTIDAVQPKIVKIFGAGGIQNLAAYGTGFFVSSQGHIATVWSHVLDADAVNVVLADGRRFTAKVLGAEPQLALAVLKLNGAEGLDFPFFEVDEATSVGTGSRVLGFSNMFNVAAGDEPVSVIHGVIAARTTLETRRGVFESPYQGPIYVVDGVTNNSGAAGGVLTTRDGRLLGMLGFELRNTKSNTWVNYAIPMTELRESIRQIISGKFELKKDPRTEEPAATLRRFKPLDFGFLLVPDVVDRTPAFVDAVQSDSASAKAGLKPDDLVLFVNDELIQTCRALQDAFGKLESGDRLRLVVRRGNELVNLEMPVPRKNE